MLKPPKQRLDNSGGDYKEDRTDSDLAIQSMIELEEKRLERMLTPVEVDDILHRLSPFNKNEPVALLSRC